MHTALKSQIVNAIDNLLAKAHERWARQELRRLRRQRDFAADYSD